MVTYNDKKIRIEIKDDCPDFYVSKLAECLTGIIVGQRMISFTSTKNMSTMR